VKKILSHEKAVLLIVSLQEAFTATVPFFLLTSVISLLHFLFAYFNLHAQIFSVHVNSYRLWQMQETFYRFSSFVATATIAYFFARRINTAPIIATVLSIATLISCLGLKSPYPLLQLPYGFVPISLINPIVAVYLFKLLEPLLSLSLPVTGGKKHIYRHINYLFVFLAAYALTVLLFEAFGVLFQAHLAAFFAALPLELPRTVLFIVRDFLTQVLWFFGIHGDRVVNSLLGKEILSAQFFPNLTYAEFNRLFVVIGGAGVGIGLLLALLLNMRDRSLRLITYISVPFVVFNINTLLIYALVVLNRYLMAPFILLPLFNFSAAYLFLNITRVNFTNYHILWNTPVFLDSQLKTGGDWRVAAFQIFLITIDTLVYIYFVQRYIQAQSADTHFERLEKNLRLSEELRSREGVNAFVAHTKVIDAQAKLDALLQNLREENLSVYYQPILPLSDTGEPGLEALLRYHEDGEIHGPTFLELVEDAGLASLVDIWVCRQVKKDLTRMRRLGSTPRISINLHPDTFLNREAVSVIIRTLRGENVGFEIVERSFLAGDAALRNLRMLQENGFTISIDDFGAGYSSLETIVHRQFTELKLDRSLVATLESTRGRLVCESIVKICHDIGTQVVAEGVETPGQLEVACEIGVDGAQGYYLAPALPLEEALEYLLLHSESACDGESGGNGDRPL